VYKSDWIARKLIYFSAHKGTVYHQENVKAVFANEEEYVYSPVGGTVDFPKEEGKRFGKGEVILTINTTSYASAPSSVEIRANSSGLFYATRDGFEDTITPENFLTMDLSEMLEGIKLVDDKAYGNISDKVSANEIIGKIVNNLSSSWAFVYLSDTDGLWKGDTINLVINEKNYTADIEKISNQPCGVVVKFTQYVNEGVEKRIENIIWSYKSPTEGIIVPLSSLCIIGEESGVYVVEEGVVCFKTVRIIDKNDEFMCVENIPEGIRVVVNPSENIEGISVSN